MAQAKRRTRRRNPSFNKLLSQVDDQRSASSSVTLTYTIDEWMRTSELEASTRKTYDGYIARTIRPVLGSVAARKIDARTLESFYTELRRCRTRCDGAPFIEHEEKGEHDCEEAECKPHKCKPMAASTVRQIHAIISGALGAAQRWGWLNSLRQHFSVYRPLATATALGAASAVFDTVSGALTSRRLPRCATQP